MRPLVITRDLQIELARYNSGIALSRAAYDLTEAGLALGDPSICKVPECDDLREHRCGYAYWIQRWADAS